MDPRSLGLDAVNKNKWPIALINLNLAARLGHTDLVLLDALGEAAYQTGSPEALGPYQNHYKYPTLATHMARAFLMLGDVKSCREFLGYAKDSALKSALTALMNIGTDINATAKIVLPVAEDHPNLYYPEYWRALAAVSDAVGREDLTVLSERNSKAYAYKDPNIHFNQALRMLGKGEFRAGWRLYEWRLVPGAHQSNRTELGSMAMWEGENLSGKSLMICLEQGLGDGIFSLRYIQSMLQKAARIEIITRQCLAPLIRSTFPDIKIHLEEDITVTGYWDDVPQADYWVYALSIPYRASLWQPLNTKKFLNAPIELVTSVKEKIRAQNPSGLPVFTINWHGRIDTDSDRTRAFTVQEFIEGSGILRSPCLIISVQKDSEPGEVAWLEEMVSRSGGQFINAAPDLGDFAKTAGWIAASDRLVTCDTSVAHVGGALGHPTTVLVRNKAIWQWRPSSDPSRALWYDGVDLQNAMTPEISWLFTTTPKEKRDENLDVPPPHVRPPGQRRPFRFAGQPR